MECGRLSQAPRCARCPPAPGRPRPTPRPRPEVRRWCRRTTFQAAAASDSATSVEPRVHVVGVKDDRYTVKGYFTCKNSTDAVWDVLTDYENLSRVYKTVDSTHIRSHDGQLQLTQVCRWEFLVFSGTFDTTLTVHEEPEQSHLRFKLLHSAFMRDFEGRWQIGPHEDAGTWVEHTLSVQPVVAPPPAMAHFTGKIFVGQVASLLGDLQAELARQLARA